MGIEPIWIWLMIAGGLLIVEVGTGTFYCLFLALAASGVLRTGH